MNLMNRNWNGMECNGINRTARWNESTRATPGWPCRRIHHHHRFHSLNERCASRREPGPYSSHESRPLALATFPVSECGLGHRDLVFEVQHVRYMRDARSRVQARRRVEYDRVYVRWRWVISGWVGRSVGSVGLVRVGR